MCIPVSFLQDLDDLREEVCGVPRAQQVQQDLLPILVAYDVRERGDDLLQGQARRQISEYEVKPQNRRLGQDSGVQR